jgi:hypothetical protein
MTHYFCLFISALVLISTAAPLPTAVRPPYRETPGEGKALVADLISRRPAANAQHFGTLKIRSERGKRFEIPVRMTLQVGQSGWQDIYETQPSSRGPAQLLIIKRAEGEPNEYWFAKATSADAPTPPSQLKIQEIYQPFAHSDFWISDLGLEFLYWPHHKVVDKEMRKGRACKVIESTTPTPAPGGYARVLSWIDNETGGLVRAEAFDANNKLLKEFSIKSVKKVGGRWRLQEMEIINAQTDSRTRLEFDLEFEAD